MSDNKYNQLASEESLIKTRVALEKNGFEVKIVDNLELAKTEVLKIIPKGSEVFTVSSVTTEQAGISKIINESGQFISTREIFTSLWGRDDKAMEMRRIGSVSDYVVGSVSAITEDGQALITSATGSQIPNYVFGANHVIWVVSSKKIVKDLTEGIKRIEDYVLDLENKRIEAAYGGASSLNKILIYRKETTKRVTIILVKENAGY